MTQDNIPHSLTVIEGGKDNTEESRKRSGKAPSGLTIKQEKFAQALANGLSLSDAYRAAYDTSKMKANVVNNEASKLSAHRGVSERVEAIIAEKQKKNSIFTERQREKHSDRIWNKVWELIDNDETPPAVKANLLSLGAKAAGMLTDRVELKQETADSKSIEAELLERLQRLRAG